MLVRYRLVLCLMAATVFCLISRAGEAQQRDTHLVPARTALSAYASSTQYYAEVRKVLGVGLSDYALAQVVVLPSFKSEYILSIEVQKDRYLLLYNTGQQSVHKVLSTKKSEKVVGPLSANRNKQGAGNYTGSPLEHRPSTSALPSSGNGHSHRWRKIRIYDISGWHWGAVG